MRDELGNGGVPLSWREVVARGAYYSGALALLRRVARAYELRGVHLRKCRLSKYVILTYHRVGTGGVPLYSALSPQLFEAQVRYLKRHYRVLSMDQLCRELREPQRTTPAVVLTIDDGYRDTHHNAFPILQKYRVPAMVYLTVSCIETGEVAWYDRLFLGLATFPGSSFECELDGPRRFTLESPVARRKAAEQVIGCFRKLPDAQRRARCRDLERRFRLPQAELADRMLTWEQVRIMQEAGIGFGAHTMTHPVVSRLSKEELRRELGDAREILESRLGQPARHFAFPFGKPEDCGTGYRPLLQQYGYESAVTTTWGVTLTADDPYALRRVSLDYYPVSSFAFRLQMLFSRGQEELPPIASSAADPDPVAAWSGKDS